MLAECDRCGERLGALAPDVCWKAAEGDEDLRLGDVEYGTSFGGNGVLLEDA